MDEERKKGSYIMEKLIVKKPKDTNREKRKREKMGSSITEVQKS